MIFRRALFAVALNSTAAAVAVGAVPAPAAACACCDGYTSRTILGWSESGRSVLVANDTAMACEVRSILEVYRVGFEAPVGCFDLYSDTPNRRTTCDLMALEHSYDPETGLERVEARSTRPRFFPRAPLALDARYVRARLSAAPEGDGARWLDVEVLGSAGWRHVHRSRVLRYVHESSEDGSITQSELTVTVYPSPRGRHALLRVEGVEMHPGIGHDTELLAWIELPEGVPSR